MSKQVQLPSWQIGQVKFFNNDKGFGFIKCLDDNQEYFVHISKVAKGPIDEDDFVVFSLTTSKKKPGTLECQLVNLVSCFTSDNNFLVQQFTKFQDEHLRQNILRTLPLKDVLEILERELTHFPDIQSDEQYTDFKKTIKIFELTFERASLKDGITTIISAWLNKVANNKYRILTWLEGKTSQSPDDSKIEEYFITADEKTRLMIFKRLDIRLKSRLVHKIILSESVEAVMNFLISHLQQVNNLSYHTDIKSKLFEIEYWQDKLDYELVNIALTQLNDLLSEEQKLRLYINGYFNIFSSEYLLSICDDLSHDDLEKCFQSKFLATEVVFKVLLAHLENEIQSLESDSTINKEDETVQESVFWIFNVAKKHLSREAFSQIEGITFKKCPNWLSISLWENGYTESIPIQAISDKLLTDVDIQTQIEKWLSRKRISKENLINILKSNIKGLNKISNRREFYVLYNHLVSLTKLNIDVNSIEVLISIEIFWFYRLANWVEGSSEEFNFEEFKTKFVFLSTEDQIKFLRKLFWLMSLNKFELTIEKLSQLTRIDFDIFTLNEQINPDIPLDISVDIVIEALKSFTEYGKFLLDSELLKIVLKDLTTTKTYKFRVRELFEECTGRYEAKFNWHRNGEVSKIPFGINQFYFAIEFTTGEEEYVHGRRGGYTRFVPNESFEELKQKVRELPGRKWNPDKLHWGVPSQYEEQVLKFARENRFFINLEGSNYANNTHLAEFNRNEIPNGITFCEGRLANVEHQLFKREFWWCCNQPCFQNCETLHSSEEWQKYTVLDFLIILGFDINDGNRVGDIVEKGKYYQFISIINRFNRLLERLYCDECNHILYPVEDAHFAHYRIVRFSCQNQGCSQHNIEIYLHHCLNGKCNGIIDSRKSQKCPNGLYICSNDTCGCCCSHDMMKRRLQNLQTTGGYIHPNLVDAVNNKLGHLERAEHFCYKCGSQMTETQNDIFECSNCGIKYDVTKNKFKRPHRQSSKSEQNQSTNPPPNFDTDDYPF